MGQMLRGEMKVPLLRAFLIEELPHGAIPVSVLIKNQDPALAKAFQKSRHIHYQRLAHAPHYRLKNIAVTRIKTTDQFAYSHYDYPTELPSTLPTVVLNESYQVIYGRHALDAAKTQNQQTIDAFIIDLQTLIKDNRPTLPIDLNVSQRLVIGIALERFIAAQLANHPDEEQATALTAYLTHTEKIKTD